jgi:NAD(P)H-nitrite reductase large subunit
MSAQVVSTQTIRIAVVGNGMVGHLFVEQLIKHNNNLRAEQAPLHISVLSAETR